MRAENQQLKTVNAETGGQDNYRLSSRRFSVSSVHFIMVLPVKINGLMDSLGFLKNEQQPDLVISFAGSAEGLDQSLNSPK